MTIEFNGLELPPTLH